MEKTGTGEKKGFEGSSKSNNTRLFSKLSPNDKKSENDKRVRWCDKWKKIHSGRCDKVVTCLKCGKIGHYANEYIVRSNLRIG